MAESEVSVLLEESGQEGTAPNPSAQGHVLRVNPLTLYFPPPLNRIITNLIKLHNTSRDHYVAYKVKTTRPNRYCVRPNLGLITPDETIELQIHFSFQKDPPTSLRTKDRFQVESIVLSSPLGPDQSLAELFKTTPKEKIEKEKLKCRFASPTPTLPEHVIKDMPVEDAHLRSSSGAPTRPEVRKPPVPTENAKLAADLKNTTAEREHYKQKLKEAQSKLQSMQVRLQATSSLSAGGLKLVPSRGTLPQGLLFGVLGVILTAMTSPFWAIVLVLVLVLSLFFLLSR